MASPTPFSIKTPLPAQDLRFEAMTHTAGLSALEEMQLALLSPKADIEPEKLLGKPIDLSVRLREGGKRHFCGIVTRFSVGHHSHGAFSYQATVRPWLWLLTRRADCRIFQEQTVPEIVEAVFKDYGGQASYHFNLLRSYRKRVYCVQYRETDFNFVARLLEDEGIYWYFEHGEGQHKLILVDAPSSHDPIAGDRTLPFYGNEGQLPPDLDYVCDWQAARAVKSGSTALRSYDFERPAMTLEVTQKSPREHDFAALELYDFQGDYVQKSDGQQMVDDRLDEQQCRFDQSTGQCVSHAMAPGRSFTLARHPREDMNADYLCTQIRLSASDQAGEAGGGPGGLQCSFEAIPADQTYRPPRRTPKPFVQGPQTAVVVGPAGDEIFTDKYGRVKVQFHWDRLGNKDEKSSCWVRVCSPWAGKSFGFVQLPRIGQEVVIDFLEGDPDQPLVTGRVYNADQMPPWDLPANATQSGVLTRSSKGGAYGNANALRFEDKKGSEQVWLHAEKNQDIEVENDETHWVGHDRKKTVDHDETTLVKHDRTETVDNNETITVHGQRTETVDKNETITIHQNRTETVDQNEHITIGVNRTESVGANETITIGSSRSISVGASETATVALQRTHSVGVNETIAIGAAQEVVIGAAQTVAVGAAQSISVGANQSTSVGANQSTDVGSNRSISVGGDQSTTVGKGRNASVSKDDSLKVGKNLVIDAGDSVTIKTGSASITMKKDGTIQIKGKDITLQGSGKINVKADSDVVVKGSKVGIN
ncbi:type VI secretion system Vgr family protein [Roseateles sp.]|uniref:type VI secretion system Vgr family protein n=1 Tax=Roseateles sp. TaxID=1971397 RepID=UPI0039E75CEE